MSFFSEEATLFSREYEVVEAMRTAWSADIQRFFDDLHPKVAGLLGVRLHWKIDRTQAQHRCWWLEPEPPGVGPVTLWYDKEYPELIRDKKMLWYAYLDVQGRPAPEAIQSAWRTLATDELRKQLAGTDIAMGPINGYKPLMLNIHWQNDPIADTAPLLAFSLQALQRAAAQVKAPR